MTIFREGANISRTATSCRQRAELVPVPATRSDPHERLDSVEADDGSALHEAIDVRTRGLVDGARALQAESQRNVFVFKGRSAELFQSS